MTEVSQVRVGDRERRAVDDRLMAAVGDGVLTLAEYDERAATLWQARTRAELDLLVADLPTDGAAVSDGPVQPADAPAVEPHAAPAVRDARPVPGRPSMPVKRLAGLVVPLALLGGVVLAGPDSTAVFGSSVERVQPAGERVEVSVLFGSVVVVVPDGARADTSGLVVFGSLDCRSACSGVFTGSDDTGQLVQVRGIGGFGSVQVLTEQEHLAAQQAERLDELDD